MDRMESDILRLRVETAELTTELQKALERSDEYFRILWLVVKKAGGHVRLTPMDLVEAPHVSDLVVSTWQDLSTNERVIEAETVRKRGRRG